jgi:hypothetical protein
MKKLGILCLFVFGLTAFSISFGSVPPTGKTTGGAAIYQDNSEITTPRQGGLSFDQDLRNLNQMESKYHERLPRLSERPELARPIKRIAVTKYHPTRATQHAGRAPIRTIKAVKTVKTVKHAPVHSRAKTSLDAPVEKDRSRN